MSEEKEQTIASVKTAIESAKTAMESAKIVVELIGKFSEAIDNTIALSIEASLCVIEMLTDTMAISEPVIKRSKIMQDMIDEERKRTLKQRGMK